MTILRKLKGISRSFSLHFSLFTSAALLLTGCSDTISSIFGGDGEIEKGDKVAFTTVVPDIHTVTRSAQSEWQAQVSSYQPVNRQYQFNISMFKQDKEAAIASRLYNPIPLVDSEGNLLLDTNGNTMYDTYGTLAPAGDDMYWQDNVSGWGFKAQSVSSENVESDQSDQTKWLFQDKLLGYGYLPIWNGDAETGSAKDNFDEINYHTSKEWYAGNKAVSEAAGLHQEPEEFKKIPLFMKHQRSWVTIILKAGEGVTREALAYATSEANIKTTIFSYPEGATKPDTIKQAWSREELVDYDSDKNGDAAKGVSSTRYDAIVEPHNFIASTANQENDLIARISVSNQNFTFAAANDLNYNEFVADGGGTEAAKQAMQAYDLKPGKHLTITATLSRASRMIKITAWVEDWTETVTQTICDDYGQNGDPILINDEEELIEFLRSEDKNKAGNVGLIVPNAMPLSDSWDGSDYNLKATLNLAGATISLGKQFLHKIDRTGSLVNGEVLVSDAFNDASAVVSENHGTVERVRVTTSGELTPARASRAGVVVTNYGTVYQCTSSLPIYGNGAYYVGGIAAENLYEGEQGIMPVIESCVVTAGVNGTDAVTAGGGIVGQAEGRVSNNTFEYGITLSQSPAKFQNIIAHIGTNTKGLTTHSHNSWPTTNEYTISGSETVITNNYSGQRYDAVIDRQAELKTLLTSEYNQQEKNYRIANSFEVVKDESNWIWGDDELSNTYFSTDAGGTYSHGNVKFKLNGNDKTITLSGNENATMLFGCVMGEIQGLNLMLAKPIVASRLMDKNNTKTDTNTDAIAALAYSVTGAGKVSNVTLKAANGSYIQSSTPAGIAVWAMEGGTLVNCASNVQIRMQLVTIGSEARRYAGGIVACAQKANITQCKYYNSADNAITWSVDGNAKKSGNFFYGGIVGGTSELPSSTTDTKPLLVITDCSSWWTLPNFSEEDTQRPTMGSLIGTTRYHVGELVYSAMAEHGNEGNWWSGTVGAGRLADGITELQAIGHKNSVTPTRPQGW